MSASNRAARFVVPIVLAIVTWLVYGDIVQLSHLGWDTWPLITASRITSVSEFFGTFSEELMDGYYADGRFYRPLVHFSFALNWLFSGADAAGYHVMDLALLVLEAWLIALLVKALFRIESGPAPLIAALFFVLHPVQMDVVTVSARRADGMCLLFTLLAMLLSLRDAKRAPLLTGIAATLAVASKETGLIVAPLVFASGYLFAEGAARERVLLALRRAAPAWIGIALFAALRTIVLSGLGGHAETGMEGAVTNAVEFAGVYGQRVFLPHGTLFGIEAATGSAVVAVVFALGLIAELVLRREGKDRPHRAALFVGIWLSLVLGISVASGRVEPWYAMAFVAVIAPIVGMLVHNAWTRVAKGEYASAMPALVASSLAVLVPLSTSLPLRPQPEWEIASSRTQRCLTRVEKRLQNVSIGDTVEASVPISVTFKRPGGGRTLSVLAPYSVRAWAALMLPDVPARFRTPKQPPPPGDVIDVVLKVVVIASEE